MKARTVGRWGSAVGVAGGFVLATLAALAPRGEIDAEAAGPDAATSVDASPPMSPYLLKAGSGTVLPPSIDDTEAFCALVLACLDIAMYPPAPDFSGCVHALMDQLSSPDALNASLSIRECGLRATSCKTLRTCALKGAESTVCASVAKDTTGPVGKCDMAGHAVQCWHEKVLGVRDCPTFNQSCVANAGKADCAFYGPCPAGVKDTWSCAGTNMVKCDGGKFLGIDCATLNLSCVSTAAGVGCAPAASSTCKSDKITCTGTNAVGCVQGKEIKVACGDQGMTCADAKTPAERVAGACEMPAPVKACDPKKFESKCDGADIVYCSHGDQRSFHCKSIGATKCVMDKGTGPRCTG